jgi:hypothetical protein
MWHDYDLQTLFLVSVLGCQSEPAQSMWKSDSVADYYLKVRDVLISLERYSKGSKDPATFLDYG